MAKFQLKAAIKAISELNYTTAFVAYQIVFKLASLGSLSKPRLRRQREWHQTKGLMSKTIAVHVRYKSLYISLPSSAKQRREMTKFCVVFRISIWN